jgi:hypothetical protein
VLILLPQQHQQQPYSCPSRECTSPPWPNKAPFSMHDGRRMRFHPPAQDERSTMPPKLKKRGSRTIGSSACCLIGLLACWLIGSLAHWLVGSLACQPNKAPSSMNAGRRMRISPPSMGWAYGFKVLLAICPAKCSDNFLVSCQFLLHRTCERLI